MSFLGPVRYALTGLWPDLKYAVEDRCIKALFFFVNVVLTVAVIYFTLIYMLGINILVLALMFYVAWVAISVAEELFYVSQAEGYLKRFSRGMWRRR